MTYPYNTHGAPAVGGGLPGLPQRGDSGGVPPPPPQFTRVATAGSGVITKPAGARWMRVAVVGGGSPGGFGGCGGGCAASKLMPAADVKYTIGAPASGSTPPASNSAEFSGRVLIGGGSLSAGMPGVGTGGDYNFEGGRKGSSGAGGGGAGPGGPGGDGAEMPTTSPYAAPGIVPSILNPDWPVRGGQGGNIARNSSTNLVTVAGGGGGTGELSRPVLASTTITTNTMVFAGGAEPADSATQFAQKSNEIIGMSTSSGAYYGALGADFGGGGGAASTNFGPGGIGGLHIDWFF